MVSVSSVLLKTNETITFRHTPYSQSESGLKEVEQCRLDRVLEGLERLTELVAQVESLQTSPRKNKMTTLPEPNSVKTTRYLEISK